MNQIVVELLVKIAEKCQEKMSEETSLEKRELFSKAYAEVTDILDEIMDEKFLEI